MLCKTCEIRDQCVSLCKLAEEYADQDKQRRSGNIQYFGDMDVFNTENQKCFVSIELSQGTAGLTGIQREIVQLRNLDLKFKQIAQRLNKTPEAVRQMYHRATKCHTPVKDKKVKIILRKGV